MKILKSPQELNLALFDLRLKKTVGFVPTMGYLHDGHRKLVKQARKENDVVVVSIFVNPLQFGAGEDYKKYPRGLARDQRILEAEKTDFLFLPDVKQLYPDDFVTEVRVSRLTEGLCGKSRPTHFAGVTTVVLKLLNVVQPTNLYLGQKDYQQYRVLRQMVKDLNLQVKVRMVPIVREPDGLALSSRNVYLSKTQRDEARFLSLALNEAKKKIVNGEKNVGTLKKAMRDCLKKAKSARVDYLEIVDADSLQGVLKLKSGQTVLIALAVYFGKTRLIDNMLVKGK
jgi:pantoate--beta-alanine ligase